MAKAKSLGKIKTQPKEKVERKTVFCTGCDSSLTTDKFYKSYNPSHKTGILPYCKECMVKMVTDESGMIDEELFIEMLRKVDRPYIYMVYESSLDESDTVRSFTGYYMKNIALPQYRSLGFKDSLFLKEDEEVVDEKETKKIKSKKDRYKLTMSERNGLIDKWGEFDDEHLCRFESKFKKLSKNYEIITTLHLEGLMNYCKYSTLSDISIERDNTASAKMYGDLAKQARTDAKLNPSQLSKSDLNTGVASFSEVSQLVAQRDGLIRLPMKYLKKPHDQLDVLLWENVNFNRALFNMPEITYEEMYDYYQQRLRKFNEKYNADLDNGNLGTWLDE